MLPVVCIACTEKFTDPLGPYRTVIADVTMFHPLGAKRVRIIAGRKYGNDRGNLFNKEREDLYRSPRQGRYSGDAAKKINRTEKNATAGKNGNPLVPSEPVGRSSSQSHERAIS